VHLGNGFRFLCKLCANRLHSAPFAYNEYSKTHHSTLKTKASGSNSVVESQPSKLLVAGSIPVSRSMFSTTCKILNFTPYSVYSVFVLEPILDCWFRETSTPKMSSSGASITSDSSLVTASIF
jgi:hypothetical protein